VVFDRLQIWAVAIGRELYTISKAILHVANKVVGCWAADRRTAGFRSGPCPLWVIRVRSARSRHSRFVRFAPKADMRELAAICLLRAKRGLTHF
jgi:hypothetical protein